MNSQEREELRDIKWSTEFSKEGIDRIVYLLLLKIEELEYSISHHGHDGFQNY